MKIATIAYLAGILDGEGTVNIAHLIKRDEYRLRLQIVNTDKRLIDWLGANFKGHIYEVKGHRRNNPRWRTRYEYFFFPKKDNLPLLKAMLPFLICKKEQVELAIRFIETIGQKDGIRLTRAAYETRKECKARLNVLNARGVKHEDRASND